MSNESLSMGVQPYEVAHSFSDKRKIINYDGLYVLVDRADDGTWDLSGTPANHDEMIVLKELTAKMNDQSELNVQPIQSPQGGYTGKV